MSFNAEKERFDLARIAQAAILTTPNPGFLDRRIELGEIHVDADSAWFEVTVMVKDSEGPGMTHQTFQVIAQDAKARTVLNEECTHTKTTECVQTATRLHLPVRFLHCDNIECPNARARCPACNLPI